MAAFAAAHRWPAERAASLTQAGGRRPTCPARRRLSRRPDARRRRANRTGAAPHGAQAQVHGHDGHHGGRLLRQAREAAGGARAARGHVRRPRKAGHVELRALLRGRGGRRLRQAPPRGRRAGLQVRQVAAKPLRGAPRRNVVGAPAPADRRPDAGLAAPVQRKRAKPWLRCTRWCAETIWALWLGGEASERACMTCRMRSTGAPWAPSDCRASRYSSTTSGPARDAARSRHACQTLTLCKVCTSQDWEKTGRAGKPACRLACPTCLLPIL